MCIILYTTCHKSTMQDLESEGWHLKPEADSTIKVEKEEGLRQAVLNTDLKEIGQPFLPDDVNRAQSSSLKGQHVLQVVSILDVTKPSNGLGSNSHRLLRVQLTDGKATCCAAEFKHTPQLHDQLPPGTKLALTNVQIKLGVLLLDQKTVKVLGGTVPHLVEAWQFQRKYGSLSRLAAVPDGLDRPPPFQTFIPGRRHNAAGRGRAPAQQAVFPGSATAPSQAGPPQSRAAAPAGGPPPGFAQPSPSQPPTTSSSFPIGIHNSAAATAAAGPGTPGPPGQPQAPDKQPEARPREQAGAVQRNQSQVKSKLLDRLADEDTGRRGRGPRRGRRRFDDDDDDPSHMTLEEFEAQQRAQQRPPGLASTAAQPVRDQRSQDEQLAWEMQRQFDLEDANGEADHAPVQQLPQSALGVAHDLTSSLFSFDRQEEDTQFGRGRGRGRRGGRRGGRGRR